MAITANLVKELRERTGAGMMECKKALQQTEGNIEEAIDLMRKAGQAKAVKKAGRIAAEGVIVVKQSVDAKQVAMLEINCETDFVARDENFQNFVDNVAEIALNNKATSIAELSNLPYDNGAANVETARQELISKIGENIQLRRIQYISSDNSLGCYVHSNRIGVIVDARGGDDTLAKDIAMHIAASGPIVVSPDDVPVELIEKEKEIFTAQAKESGKPDDIIEKMISGRINKYLDEVSLLGQPFVKDPNTKISQLLKNQSAEVLTFSRFEVGEGLEKKEENFAEEVMSQVREH